MYSGTVVNSNLAAVHKYCSLSYNNLSVCLGPHQGVPYFLKRLLGIHVHDDACLYKQGSVFLSWHMIETFVQMISSQKGSCSGEISSDTRIAEFSGLSITPLV